MSKFDITKTEKNGYIVNLSPADWELYDVEDTGDIAEEAKRRDAASELNKALEDALNSEFHVAQVMANMERAMSNQSEWGAGDSMVRDILFTIGEELFDEDIADEHFNI